MFSDEMPRHQAAAEVRIPLASRAMKAPCHEESARIRGCPRLPSPAMRRFSWYARQGGGSDSSISLRASCGGLDVRGGHCCIFAQNRTGSQLAGGEKAQPLMMFRQDKRFAAGCESVAIALFDGLGCFTACEAEVFSADRRWPAQRALLPGRRRLRASVAASGRR